MSARAGKFTFVALIDEARCVGCSRCLQVCPVDAIVGAANLMHTVIAAECIGCKLCLRPCPVDCIAMIPTPEPIRPQTHEAISLRAELAKRRYRARCRRLSQEAQERRAKLEASKAVLLQRK